jgi:hypothetical protein
VIRRMGLSGTHMKALWRAASALGGATVATGALAQSVTQTLTVNFTDASPVPMGGWISVALAISLAVVGALVLRRRSSTGAWLWVAAAIGTGALLTLQTISGAQAIPPTTPLSLVTSPASVVFTFPGAPTATNVQLTNNVGGPTTITAITLQPGPYDPAPGQTTCTVGLVLPASGTCLIGLTQS